MGLWVELLSFVDKCIALDTLIRSRHNIKYIKILSDSQVAIAALHKPRITSKAVLTLEYMETLATQVDHLTLAWIKTHVGIDGNEQADQAAKEWEAGGLNLKQLDTPMPW